METECTQRTFAFHGLGSREVIARFDGGHVTSDAGGLLLREVEQKFGFLERFARCFTDHRAPDLVEHSVLDLVKQRVFALCLGYEDLNDHDRLRLDPLLAVLVGKHDPTGQDRLRERDKGRALAGKSTLNRLELTPPGADEDSRYKKIVARVAKIQEFFVDAFLIQHSTPPERIVIDVDATDDPIHGHQLGKFFHGYYDCDCYLPLYAFCGEHPLCALLRPADIDAAAGALKQIRRIVEHIRRVWPDVTIVIRGDSGFCRDEILAWCEAHGVHYVIGLSKNTRLRKILGGELHEAKRAFEETGRASRVFKDFTYRTHHSWSRERRVVGKAEHLAKGANPRFVVTSIPAEEIDARTLYEDEYCGRGNMENRIKEQQLMLFADRTSCATMRANQIRLCLSTAAFILMRALREFGLKETELAEAQCDTIRTRLLKIGAVVKISVRRVCLSLSESYPLANVFERVAAALTSLRPPIAFANTG